MSGGLTPKVGLEVEEVAEQACEGFRQFGQVAWVEQVTQQGQVFRLKGCVHLEQVLQSFDELICQPKLSTVREAAGIQQADQLTNQGQVFGARHAAIAALFRGERQQGVEQGAAQIQNTVGANEGFEAVQNGDGSQAAKVNPHQGALQQANIGQCLGILLVGQFAQYRDLRGGIQHHHKAILQRRGQWQAVVIHQAKLQQAPVVFLEKVGQLRRNGAQVAGGQALNQAKQQVRNLFRVTASECVRQGSDLALAQAQIQCQGAVNAGLTIVYRFRITNGNDAGQEIEEINPIHASSRHSAKLGVPVNGICQALNQRQLQNQRIIQAV